MSNPNDAYNVTADELRQFIERFEQLESEKKDVTEQQKELMAEAKGRGYDTKVMKKIIALRKRDKTALLNARSVWSVTSSPSAWMSSACGEITPRWPRLTFRRVPWLSRGWRVRMLTTAISALAPSVSISSKSWRA